MVSPPDWLSQFANAITSSIHSHDALPPIGCHFHSSKDQWEVTLFVSRTEIIGGSEDGRSTNARFQVDVKAVLSVFTRVDAISWQTHSLGRYDELGSHLSVEGQYDGQQVWLRITSTAPERFEAGRIALVNRQEFEEVW